MRKYEHMILILFIYQLQDTFNIWQARRYRILWLHTLHVDRCGYRQLFPAAMRISNFRKFQADDRPAKTHDCLTTLVERL